MNGNMYDPKIRTWAEIDIASVRHNYRCIRSLLQDGCGIMGVVKADSYGHGAVRISGALVKMGCDYLAVATIDEAAELRAAGVGAPILVLGRTPPYLARELAGLGVAQSVGNISDAKEMSRHLSEHNMKLKIHVELETGMGRTGFGVRNDNGFTELAELLALPGLDAEGVFTHFADTDDYAYTKWQHALFCDAVSMVEKRTEYNFKIKHCANSGATIGHGELHMDMVRTGLALYGMYPGPRRENPELRPAMSLRTRIASISEHEAGDTVGYGRTYRVMKKSRVAVLPVGYADGLHRVLSNNMYFLVRGKRARQVGQICMDMCMADVTDVPGCSPGDIATVFGRDGDDSISVEELACNAGTINYEMVCAVSKRVPRVYV
jgi:alanine racemase